MFDTSSLSLVFHFYFLINAFDKFFFFFSTWKPGSTQGKVTVSFSVTFQEIELPSKKKKSKNKTKLLILKFWNPMIQVTIN